MSTLTHHPGRIGRKTPCVSSAGDDSDVAMQESVNCSADACLWTLWGKTNARLIASALGLNQTSPSALPGDHESSRQVDGLAPRDPRLSPSTGTRA